MEYAKHDLGARFVGWQSSEDDVVDVRCAQIEAVRRGVAYEPIELKRVFRTTTRLVWHRWNSSVRLSASVGARLISSGREARSSRRL